MGKLEENHLKIGRGYSYVTRTPTSFCYSYDTPDFLNTPEFFVRSKKTYSKLTFEKKFQMGSNHQP